MGLGLQIQMVLKFGCTVTIPRRSEALSLPFPSFPDGLRGFALLWLRLAVAALLLQGAAICWIDNELWACILRGLAALFIAIGFMTPAFGVVVAFVEVAWMVSYRAEMWRSSFLLASILIALTVLGPGAYSIDRLLFGRKRLTIGHSPR